MIFLQKNLSNYLISQTADKVKNYENVRKRILGKEDSFSVFWYNISIKKRRK